MVQALGGIGLFLLGMVILTEGLRSLAGNALQRVLRSMTRSPASGAGAGALVTALIQSSSATTVSAVGFAGAGLLTFPEALGIVFGANLGTTVTGWLVTLLGFKLRLGEIAPLVVLLGVLLRLFGRDRSAAAGLALAGFGLVFVGIELLQEGASRFDDLLAPDRFPADSALGRLLLVGLGVVFTLITQSSSAGVATTLAALHSGAVSFPQAASLVIGMDVGTTATAALATVGASLAARRTGWAHVIYNLFTAAGAFLLLPLYVRALEWTVPGGPAADPELALVGFHTLFNAVGVLAVLPVARPFARLVERLVPERPLPWTERLDRSLLDEPELALRAAAPTLEALAQRAFHLLARTLREGEPARTRRQRQELTRALGEVGDYLGRISRPPRGADSEAREVAALHVLDQLRRLLGRLAQEERIASVRTDPELGAIAERLIAACPAQGRGSPDERKDGEERLAALAHELEQRRDAWRDAVLRRASRDELSPREALERLDAYRWVERVARHTWRIVHHLRELERERPEPPTWEPPEPTLMRGAGTGDPAGGRRAGGRRSSPA